MGAQLLGVIFVACLAFAISRSMRRARTVLYALGAMAAVFCLTFVFSFIPDKESVGAATFDVMLLVGALTALIHSRKNKA
jgi:Na+/H+ antiporter NhaD/arsenite permease-like protein